MVEGIVNKRGSSNGRTSGFDPGNLRSSRRPRAKRKLLTNKLSYARMELDRNFIQQFIAEIQVFFQYGGNLNFDLPRRQIVVFG